MEIKAASTFSLLFAVALLVSSCATVSGLSNKKPDVVVASARTPHDLAACIASQWGQHYAGANTNIQQDGYVVSIPNQMAGTDAVATITRTESGSRIAYTERMPSLSPTWMKAAVTVCK
jgi:uncharacterized protein YceK